MPDKTILADTDKKMGASVQDARHKPAAVRTGRASLAMFDGVSVDYYGTPTLLDQVAKLSIPEPTMVVAQPFDPSTLGAIEKAILAADLGLNPANDGKLTTGLRGGGNALYTVTGILTDPQFRVVIKALDQQQEVPHS